MCSGLFRLSALLHASCSLLADNAGMWVKEEGRNMTNAWPGVGRFTGSLGTLGPISLGPLVRSQDEIQLHWNQGPRPQPGHRDTHRCEDCTELLRAGVHLQFSATIIGD